MTSKEGLAANYPLYRGHVGGDDGKVRRGHLSYAIRLYGSPDGRNDSPLYVPAGFVSHSNEVSPTDAAVTFYYPKLGNLTDMTLAVFHVADFQISSEGDRVRIGNIGGHGGSSPLYKHSHIEFCKGNVRLPAAAARAALRINPATVFGVEPILQRRVWPCTIGSIVKTSNIRSAARSMCRYPIKTSTCPSSL